MTTEEDDEGDRDEEKSKHDDAQNDDYRLKLRKPQAVSGTGRCIVVGVSVVCIHTEAQLLSLGERDSGTK